MSAYVHKANVKHTKSQKRDWPGCVVRVWTRISTRVWFDQSFDQGPDQHSGTASDTTDDMLQLWILVSLFAYCLLWQMGHQHTASGCKLWCLV